MIARMLEMLIEQRKPPKPWATLEEAAEELGLSRRFVYRLVRSGSLDAIRDGKIKVRRQDLEDIDVTSELVKPAKPRRKR
jgi:excisionase family DNA binding protein